MSAQKTSKKENTTENEVEAEQPIVLRKQQDDWQPVQPGNVPDDLDAIINSTIATANIEGQIASQRIRDFIMEFKGKYPDVALKCKETIAFTIDAEQTNSLLSRIFGSKPDAKFRITKAYTPDYETE